MKDEFDGRVDHELRRAGEQWRARRPAAASVDRSLYASEVEPRRSWLPVMASALGVLAVVVVGILIFRSLPPANPDVAAGSPSPSAHSSPTSRPLGTSTATREPVIAGAVELIVSGRGDLECGRGQGQCAMFFGVDDDEWQLEYREDPFPRVTLPDGQFVRLEPGDHRLVAHIDAVSDALQTDEPGHSVVDSCDTQLRVETSMALLTVEIAFADQGPCEINAYPLNPTEPLPDRSPLPSVASTETFVVEGTRWERYGAEYLPSGVEYFDWIETSGSRIFARVHECPSSRAPCRYMLLSSVDGRSWTVEAQIARGIDFNSPIRIFPDDEVGFIAAAGLFYDRPRAGLWHSIDGTDWDWVGNQASFDVPECESIDSFELYEVYRAGTQLVAQALVYCGPKVYFRTWSSTDGRRWNRVDYVPATAVVEQDGVFVGIAGTPRHNALTRSDDGFEWETALETEIQFTVAPIASGFVAVGGRDGQDPVVMTSVDGRSWTEHADALDAVSYGSLGSDGTRAAFVVHSGPMTVWVSSPDAKSWTSYPLPAEVDSDYVLVTVLGDMVVVASSSEPTVWVARVADMPG